MLSLGSLFAGMGGFDAAAERTGMRVAWQVEIDPQARRVLAKHWPGVERHEDVRTVDPSALGAVDVVCGGVPCQDWSRAGKRAGLSGGRAGLFFDFVRLADALAPRWLLFENVPGLLSAGGGEDFATVLEEITGFRPAVPDGGLRNSGWRNGGVCSGRKRHACWRVLDSKYFGVAQQRRRVFLVASAPDASCVEILFESEGGAGDLAPGREEGPDAAGAAAAGSGVCGVFGDVSPTLVGRGHDASEDGTGSGTPVVAYRLSRDGSHCGLSAARTEVAQTIGAGSARDVGRNQGGTLIAFQCCGNQFSRQISLRSGAASLPGGVPFLVNEEAPWLCRRITPTEALRLQGFQDDWLDTDPPIPDGSKYRLAGNSVALPVVTWILSRLAEVAVTEEAGL